MAPLRSLGILGGSFNPVHSGHVLLARYAREALGLDEVWLMPCAVSADGKKSAPGALRLRWLRKALRGEQGLKASDMELKRGGISRTVDTLRQLQERLGPSTVLTLLLGQDQALRLSGWKESKLLPHLCRLAVFPRPGYPKRLPRGFKGRFVDVPVFGISSSYIRTLIKKNKNLSLCVPPALANDAELLKWFGPSGRR